MLTYLFIGTIWSWWLEYYTTTRLDMGWNLRARVLSILLWPIGVFNFIRSFLGF